MKRARVIPILLLQNRGLHKSVRFSQGKYIGDPLNAVRIFNDKQCDELILLDTGASKTGSPIDFRLIGEIASECFMPLAYGGGVTTLSDIEKLLKLGIEKVSLNSVLFSQPAFLREAVTHFGSSTIVVSVDVKKNLFGQYKVFSHAGLQDSKYDLDSMLNWFNDENPGEVVVNSVDLDGTMKGYDLTLARKVSTKLSMPVVLAGGCKNFEDIRQILTETPVSAAAAGSFFVFQGPHRGVLISYPSPDQITQIYGTSAL
jgi:cyclase